MFLLMIAIINLILLNIFDIKFFIPENKSDFVKIQYMLASYVYVRGKLPSPVINGQKSYLPYEALGLAKKDVLINGEVMSYHAELFTEKNNVLDSISLAATIHQGRLYISKFCVYEALNPCDNFFANHTRLMSVYRKQKKDLGFYTANKDKEIPDSYHHPLLAHFNVNIHIGYPCFGEHINHPSFYFFFDSKDTKLFKKLSKRIESLLSKFHEFLRGNKDPKDLKDHLLFGPYAGLGCYDWTLNEKATVNSRKRAYPYPKYIIFYLGIIQLIQESIPSDFRKIKIYNTTFFNDYINNFIPRSFISSRNYELASGRIHYGYTLTGQTVFYGPKEIPNCNMYLITEAQFTEICSPSDNDFIVAIIGNHPTNIDIIKKKHLTYKEFSESNCLPISKATLFNYMPKRKIQNTKLPNHELCMGGSGTSRVSGQKIEMPSCSHTKFAVGVPFFRHKWRIPFSDDSLLKLAYYVVIEEASRTETINPETGIPTTISRPQRTEMRKQIIKWSDRMPEIKLFKKICQMVEC